MSMGSVAEGCLQFLFGIFLIVLRWLLHLQLFSPCHQGQGFKDIPPG